MRLPTRRRRKQQTLINSPLARWPFAIITALALIHEQYLPAVLCAAIAWAGWTPRPRRPR